MRHDTTKKAHLSRIIDHKMAPPPGQVITLGLPTTRQFSNAYDLPLTHPAFEYQTLWPIHQRALEMIRSFIYNSLFQKLHT